MECLPLYNNSQEQTKKNNKRKKNLYIRDEALQGICEEHRIARLRWEEAGRPTEGFLSDRRKALKKEIKSYVRDFRGAEVRQKNQRRDEN